MPAYKSKTKDKRPTRIKEYVAEMPKDEKDFLALARERFKIAVDAESQWRNDALDDLRFLTGDQWPQATKQARDQTNRPCLTINRLPAIKRQIVNEQRAQRPQLVVRPVGNGADVDDADILEGLLRHIEVQSDVEIADDTAFEHMVTGGRGYIEICADYLPGQTFDQELYIRRVKNPFTCYCDPASTSPDEADANWKFQIHDYPHAEYKELFPNTELASLYDFVSIGDSFPQWGDSKTIRVAKYWHKDWEDDTLLKLSDGQVLTKTNYDLRHKNVPEDQKLTVVAERPYRKCTITCSVINGVEVIEEFVFPGKVGYIPLIPCLGEDFDINGVRYLAGLIREAKDPQRSINYFRSHAAETIALAPKAPFIGWKGQFKDPKWNTANSVNYAFLEADVVTTEGQPAPSLPQRSSVEPPIQAVLALSQVIDGDLKAVTGIYEPGLGQPKGDQSGKAITSLQGQSQLTNLNFTDNLSRMKRHVGRVLLDAAPFIYDSPRVQRIVDPDGTADFVIMHSGGNRNAAEALKTPEIQDIYDLSMGSYDVVVDVGPAYKTRRLEAFSQLSNLAQADKTGEIFKVSADLIMAMSDAPEAKLISKRLKKAMPPDLVNDDPNDPRQQLQQLQATKRQLEAQNQELMKQNAQFIDTIKTEKIQQEYKIETAKIQAAAQVEVAGLNAKLEQAKLEFAKFELLHTSAHDRAMAAGAETNGDGTGGEETGEAAPPPPANGGSESQGAAATGG